MVHDTDFARDEHESRASVMLQRQKHQQNSF